MCLGSCLSLGIHKQLKDQMGFLAAIAGKFKTIDHNKKLN